jgi:hypothetical protein
MSGLTIQVRPKFQPQRQLPKLQLNKSPEQPHTDMEREDKEYFAELTQRLKRNDLEAKVEGLASEFKVWRESAALLVARSSGRYGSPFSMEPANLQSVVPLDVEHVANLVDLAAHDTAMWIMEPGVGGLDDEDETIDTTFPVELALPMNTGTTSPIPMLSPSTSDKTVVASPHASPLFKPPKPVARKRRPARPPTCITAPRRPPSSSVHSFDYPPTTCDQYESIQDAVKRRKRKYVTSRDIVSAEPSASSSPVKHPRISPNIPITGKSSSRNSRCGDVESAQPPSPPSSQKDLSPRLPAEAPVVVATTSSSFEHGCDRTRSDPGCSEQRYSRAPPRENGRTKHMALPHDSRPPLLVAKRKRAEEQESDYDASESETSQSDSEWSPLTKKPKCAQKSKQDSSKHSAPLSAKMKPTRSATNVASDGPHVCNYWDPLEGYVACDRAFSRLPDMERHRDEHHGFKEAKAAYRPAETGKKLEKCRATAVISAAISRMVHGGEPGAKSEAMKARIVLEDKKKKGFQSLKINLNEFPLLERVMEDVARDALEKYRCADCGRGFTRLASRTRHKEVCRDPKAKRKVSLVMLSSFESMQLTISVLPELMPSP